MRHRGASATATVAVVVGAAVIALIAHTEASGQNLSGADQPVVRVTLTVTVPHTSGVVTVPPLGGGTGSTNEAASPPDSSATTTAGSPAVRASGTAGSAGFRSSMTSATTLRTSTTVRTTRGPTSDEPGRATATSTSRQATASSSRTSPAAPVISTTPSHVDPITQLSHPSDARIARSVQRAVNAAAADGITESVVVLDRSTDATVVSYGARQSVPAVSIAKLLFAVDELDNAPGGRNLDPQASADLFDMISRSDDTLADDYYGNDGEGDIVERVAHRYHLTGTQPAPNPRYWGGITVTAADVASLLRQALADPSVGPYLAQPMKAASVTAADGFGQEFGMNAVSGAGSKQGWGCCLGGVVAIHSAGFTASEIVVVLSTAAPDASGLNVPQVAAFDHDPGFVEAEADVTATVKAAVDP